MRGQTSIEYLILIGIVFVIIMPIFYYATQESSRTIQMNQANEFVNTLAKTADTVYSLGPGTKDYVFVTIPGGTESITISNHEILLKLRIFGGVSDVFAETMGEITGSIPATPGTKHVSVEMLETKKVLIGTAE